MRPDMSKVVTESPRWGHGASSMKTGRTLSKDEYDADDHGSTRHKVSRRGQYGYDSKEFSDLLGPLRRYLRKQVGRSWNSVYSELSQHLDRRSISGLHIWDHVKSEVEINTYLNGSSVHARGRYGYWRPVEGLYVHPTNGLLCYKQIKRHRFSKRVDPDLKKLTKLTELHRENGIWFFYEFRMEMKYRPVWKNEKMVYVPDGEQQVLVIKRQLGKKDLKKYKLSNTVIPPIPKHLRLKKVA